MSEDREATLTVRELYNVYMDGESGDEIFQPKTKTVFVEMDEDDLPPFTD